MNKNRETWSQTTETSYNVLNKDEQEALDYYLQGGRRAEPRGYKGPERRSPKSQIDRLIPTLVGMKMSSREGAGLGGEVLNYFQDMAPVSLQEATTLMDGAVRRVSNAENTGKGDPEEAVKDRYYTFAGYLLDAAEDMDVLNHALIGHPRGGLVTDIDYLRKSHEVHEVFAKQFMSRGFLWDRFWPSRNHNAYKERHKYWLGFSVAAAKFASDDELSMLFEFSRRRSERRLHAWVEQMGQIEDLPVIKKLIDEEKIIPLSYRRLWHQRTHQLELEMARPQPDASPKTETNIDDLIPAEVRAAVKEQRQREQEMARLDDEEYDREYEKKLQIPFMTHERARAELLRDGIGFAALEADGEIHSPESKREWLEISARAHELEKKKKAERSQKVRNTKITRRRSRLRWTRQGKDRGPPPHISEDVRWAQGID